MIINSTYTVYKKGNKNNQRKQSMPSSDRYIHFFWKSFFCHTDRLDMYTDHPIKYQLKGIWPGISFVLSANLRNSDASLHNCIKTEISTVFRETSSFKEQLINTDCVGEIWAKAAQKHLITDAASKERYCSKSTETSLLLSYWIGPYNWLLRWLFT